MPILPMERKDLLACAQIARVQIRKSKHGCNDFGTTITAAHQRTDNLDGGMPRSDRLRWLQDYLFNLIELIRPASRNRLRERDRINAGSYPTTAVDRRQAAFRRAGPLESRHTKSKSLCDR